MFKAGLVGHGEDDEEAVSRPHVLLPHGAELLLAGCVQHCQDGGAHMYYFGRGLSYTDILMMHFIYPYSTITRLIQDLS